MPRVGEFTEVRRKVPVPAPVADYPRQQALLTASLATTFATSASQPADEELTQIAALTPSEADFMQYKAGEWKASTPSAVRSDLSIDDVDNTSDADKPISDATQTALNGKLQWSVVPATASEPASAGQVAYDADYLYVAVATNEWKRVALTTW